MDPKELSAVTAATMGHHMQGMGSGNPDRILEDYAENAVLFTAQGPLRGHEQIRGFYAQMGTLVPPDALRQFQMTRQDIDGETAFAIWSMGPGIPFGTETFQVHEGKIVVHTFALHQH